MSTRPITFYFTSSHSKESAKAANGSNKRSRVDSEPDPPKSNRNKRQPTQKDLSTSSIQDRFDGSKRRDSLKAIADATLEALELGSYTLNGLQHNLVPKITVSKDATRFYAPSDACLSTWKTPVNPTPGSSTTKVTTEVLIREISTLDGARLLASTLPNGQDGSRRKIAILNFASATKPGGGFLNGASAQEESIARSSSLYPSLMTTVGQEFYEIHTRQKKTYAGASNYKRKHADVREGKGGGFYTHAMIYSPNVLLFRDDAGAWLEPVEVDVLTSAAVNAGVVRRELLPSNRDRGKDEEPESDVDDDVPLDEVEVEALIEKVMRERMARILRLFEQEGVTDLVLGSFGTGVFRNRVDVVAKLWAELLGLGVGASRGPRSVVGRIRFQGVFPRVIFAILGKETFEDFQNAFWGR